MSYRGNNNCIQAGRLRHRITVQEKTDTQSAGGAITRTWSDIATSPVWAQITPTGGVEEMQGDQQVAIVTHRVVSRADVFRPGRRIKYGSRYFYIVSAINYDELGRLYIAKCEEDEGG